MQAHEHARAVGTAGATDDAQLVLANGGQVRAVEGSFEGFKVTTNIDLLFARQVLETRRRDWLG
jgi:2-C-methyl-D-erythritol 4-phosphate cytidylyltransferase